MKLFSKYISQIIVLVVLFAAVDSYGQCKGFTKREGFPAIKPYTHNGQITRAKFMPGDEAEIE